MGRTAEKLIVRNYVDVVKADEGLINSDQIRTVEVDAIVDTGTTYVCLGREEIEALGLRFHNTVPIKTVNGLAERRTFEGAQIEHQRALLRYGGYGK